MREIVSHHLPKTGGEDHVRRRLSADGANRWQSPDLIGPAMDFGTGAVTASRDPRKPAPPMGLHREHRADGHRRDPATTTQRQGDRGSPHALLDQTRRADGCASLRRRQRRPHLASLSPDRHASLLAAVLTCSVEQVIRCGKPCRRGLSNRGTTKTPSDLLTAPSTSWSSRR